MMSYRNGAFVFEAGLPTGLLDGLDAIVIRVRPADHVASSRLAPVERSVDVSAGAREHPTRLRDPLTISEPRLRRVDGTGTGHPEP
jgi:hypothetical protein